VAKKTKDTKLKKKTRTRKTKQQIIKKITMEEVYRLLNRVQVNKKSVHFVLSPEDALIASNVITDLGLPCTSTEIDETAMSFTIEPLPEEEMVEDFDDDVFELFTS